MTGLAPGAAMREARKHDRGDMSNHQGKRDVGDNLVHLFHRFAGLLGEHPGKRSSLLVSAINDEHGYHGRCKEEEQEKNHESAAGTVTDMTLSPKEQEVAHIAKGGRRGIRKVREARMRRPDKTPNDTRQDQNADRISGPDMHGEEVFLGQVGDREAQDQSPVKDPYEPVPHIDTPV